MVEIVGERVRLRDVTLADADMLEELDSLERRAGGFNDFGMSFRRADREALARGPLRNATNGLFLIVRPNDGTIVGTIAWHLVRYGPNAESNAWNIGIEIVAEARGRGMGSEAQRLLAAWLFETTPVNRVEAGTDVENIPEQRALEKAGFTRDGVIRGAQFRAGTYHDIVIYGRLRSDPE